MSDTKTTTEDERLARKLAILVNGLEGEDAEDEGWDALSDDDVREWIELLSKIRTLLAPADVALEPLSEDEIIGVLRVAREAYTPDRDWWHVVVESSADAQRAKLTRRPAESGTVATVAAARDTATCKHHPAHLAGECPHWAYDEPCSCQPSPTEAQHGECPGKMHAAPAATDTQTGERRTVAGERPATCTQASPETIALVGAMTARLPAKQPEAVPPEVTTDALDNALLGITANEYGSTHALSGREASAIRDGAEADILANLARQAEEHARERDADKTTIEALEKAQEHGNHMIVNKTIWEQLREERAADKARIAELEAQLSDIATALNDQPGRVWYKGGNGSLVEQVKSNAQDARVLVRVEELAGDVIISAPVPITSGPSRHDDGYAKVRELRCLLGLG